jgi:hypothetical protein
LPGDVLLVAEHALVRAAGVGYEEGDDHARIVPKKTTVSQCYCLSALLRGTPNVLFAGEIASSIREKSNDELSPAPQSARDPAIILFYCIKKSLCFTLYSPFLL